MVTIESLKIGEVYIFHSETNETPYHFICMYEGYINNLYRFKIISKNDDSNWASDHFNISIKDADNRDSNDVKELKCLTLLTN